MDLLWFLRDTKYCLLQIFADIISAISTIMGILLLSERLGGIGGISRMEILFMLGYGVAVEGLFIVMFVNGNIGQISRIIGRGQLDHNILQPVPLWTQLLTQGFAPFSGNGQLLCGIGLLWFASRQLQIIISFPAVGILVISLCCSCIIMTSVIWLISCLAFYAPAATEEIAEQALHLFSSTKSYPLGTLSFYWQAILCLVIPLGLTAWFPSRFLLNKPIYSLSAGFLLLALAALIFLLLFIISFRRGLNYYAKHGSPRYTGFGHR